MVGAAGVWLLVGIWALIQMSRSCDSFSTHQNQRSWHRWRESWVMGWSLCDLSRQKQAGFIVQTPGPHGRDPMNRRPAWVPLADLGSYPSGPAALVPFAPFSPTVSWELMFPLPTTTQRPCTRAGQAEGSGKGLNPAHSPNSSLIRFSLHWPPFIMISCCPPVPCMPYLWWMGGSSFLPDSPSPPPGHTDTHRWELSHTWWATSPLHVIRSNSVAEPLLRGRETEA